MLKQRRILLNNLIKQNTKLLKQSKYNYTIQKKSRSQLIIKAASKDDYWNILNTLRKNGISFQGIKETYQIWLPVDFALMKYMLGSLLSGK